VIFAKEGIMNPTFFLMVLVPCVFAVLALFMIIVGLRGIVTRKPFLLSARWLFAVMVLAIVPVVLQPFLVQVPRVGDEAAILFWLGPLMFAGVVIFMWFTLRGYLAFAVTDSSFREGLLASLNKLELPHEEKLATLRLPSVRADLQVAVQSWIGTGQIKVKQRQFTGLLRGIVKGMNAYYQSSTVPVNLACCIFYVAMGVLVIVSAGVFLFRRLG
jgi:hypothetical protein